MKNFLLVGLCFVVFKTFSQNPVNDYISLRDQLLVYGSGDEGSKAKFKGSPYLEKDFEKGVILTVNKNEQPAFFRYNVFEDQVEIKVNPSDQEIFILPRSDDFRFKIADYTLFLAQMATDEREVLSGYIMEYYRNGKTMLLAKPVYDIKSAKAAETSYDRGRPARIRINVRYYLGVDDQPLKRINLKEKYFRKILGNSPEMQKYFAENRIKGKDDVVEMLRFYDAQN